MPAALPGRRAPRRRGPRGNCHHTKRRTLPSGAGSGGSSPLARGLPPVPGHAGQRRRIIPARAGFTAATLEMVAESADHPRSRGVYPTWPAHKQNHRGSSPLARGLHHRGVGGAGQTRIIPARAGFTRRRRGSRPRPRDHPRSRGVYKEGVHALLRRIGSSPLARGLRHGIAVGRVGARIIPARAGFTWRASGRSRARPDHPRSRGVYSLLGVADMTRDGSSPLARGLRGGEPSGLLDAGIIPARAGFTLPRAV